MRFDCRMTPARAGGGGHSSRCPFAHWMTPLARGGAVCNSAYSRNTRLTPARG